MTDDETTTYGETPEAFPTIEEMPTADLLAAIDESLSGARNYASAAMLPGNLLNEATISDLSIATGDIIDALDNLTVVVKRLSEGRA